MIVTAALAWWNERPNDLVTCVRGVARIADRLVAVDGAYRRYPNPTITSSEEQAAAIRRAAKKAGIEVVIIEPDRLWAGQVEKRTFLLREAAKGSDWIVVVDADHVIQTDRVEARAALEAMPKRVRSVGVDFTTPMNKQRSLRKSSATNWHANMAGETHQMAQIFRALPDFRVVDRHWIYAGTYMGSEIELRYGGKPDAMIGVPYLVEHRTMFRTDQQILDSRAFCNDRVMVMARTGQEDDVPGLPEPDWDVVTIPYLGRLRNDGLDIAEDDMAVIKPQAPKNLPIRVLTLGEAEHALASGYEKVFVRVNEGLMAPTLPHGEIVLLGQAVPKTGDLTLVHVLGRWRVRRVVDITPSGRIKVRSERSPAIHLATKFRGTVIWHGAKEAHYQPEPKPVAEVKVDARTRRAKATAAVASAPARRRGRPPKVRTPAAQ